LARESLRSRSALQRSHDGLDGRREVNQVAITDASPIELIDELSEHGQPGSAGRNEGHFDPLDDGHLDQLVHLNQVDNDVDRCPPRSGSSALLPRALAARL
jgi:hypothetical protein